MLNLDSIQICWTDTGVLSISGSSNTCMYRRLFWHAMKLGRISNNFLKFCELTACEWEITMWHFIGGQPNFQELCAQPVNLVHCKFHLPMMQGISFSVDFYMQCHIALEIFAIFYDTIWWQYQLQNFTIIFALVTKIFAVLNNNICILQFA